MIAPILEEVVDDYTVKLHLKDPYAPLMLALGSATSGIIPEKLVTEVGMDEFDKHPVGTGAFKMTEWALGRSVTFERNTDYYMKGVPKLDTIVFEIGQDAKPWLWQ